MRRWRRLVRRKNTARYAYRTLRYIADFFYYLSKEDRRLDPQQPPRTRASTRRDHHERVLRAQTWQCRLRPAVPPLSVASPLPRHELRAIPVFANVSLSMTPLVERMVTDQARRRVAVYARHPRQVTDLAACAFSGLNLLLPRCERGSVVRLPWRSAGGKLWSCGHPGRPSSWARSPSS